MDKGACRRLAAELVRSHRAEGVDVEALGTVLDGLPREELAAAAVVFREGERADDMQVLVRGTVSVRVAEAGGSGPGQEVARLGAPAILGHLGVLTGLPRNATVTAVEPIELARLRSRDLWELFERGTPGAVSLRRLLLASLAGLMEQTNARLGPRVAERGVLVPPDAEPTRKPAEKAAEKAAAAREESWGFDADLLRAADEVRVVEAEADRSRKYKR